MQFEEFNTSTNGEEPPKSMNACATALWYDAKGNWQQAHNIVQDLQDKTAAHIHAYLHRKEGDAGNATYWYRRAGATMPVYSLIKEWEELVRQVLGRTTG